MAPWEGAGGLDTIGGGLRVGLGFGASAGAGCSVHLLCLDFGFGISRVDARRFTGGLYPARSVRARGELERELVDALMVASRCALPQPDRLV